MHVRVCLCVCEHWQLFHPEAAGGFFLLDLYHQAAKVSTESAAEGVSFINTVSVSS